MRVCVPGYQNRGFKSCGNDSEVFDAAEITANQEESSEAASDRSCLQEREGHSSQTFGASSNSPSLCHEFDWLVLLYLSLQCCDSSEERLCSQAPPSQILEGGAWERWAQETCNEAHTHTLHTCSSALGPLHCPHQSTGRGRDTSLAGYWEQIQRRVQTQSSGLAWSSACCRMNPLEGGR